MGRVVAWIAGVGVSACAVRTPVVEAPVSAGLPEGCTPQVSTRLYLGRGIGPNGAWGTVGDDDVEAFLDAQVRPRLDGLTMLTARGWWQGVSEDSLVVEVVHDGAASEALQAVAGAWGEAFAQSGVLRTDTAVCVSEVAGPGPGDGPTYRWRIGPIPAARRAIMQGTTLHPDCPVGFDDLVQLSLDHWGNDARVHRGTLIVHRDVATDVAKAFGQLFDARFPVHSMRPASDFAGIDEATMDANNTSAFNCRPVAGTDRPSEHSLGTAIDINPRVNPWMRWGYDDKRKIERWFVEPESGRRYVDRPEDAPGIILPGGVVDRAFKAIGWGWGGDWDDKKDWQHVSRSGH